MKAMVFAAGNGTRLRPFTLHHPKALVKVGGTPMLQHVIENLKATGVTQIVVNVHHFAEQIEQFLAANANFGINIAVTDERALLLDTGGGLLNARRFLDGTEPILLHNADILTNLPLDSLTLHGNATLAVSHRQSSRSLVFDNDNRLCGWINHKTSETKGNADGLCYSFNGIHLVSPQIFPALSNYGEEVFSLTPFYVANSSVMEIYGQDISDYKWFDVGKPESLADARAWADSLR
ncbi:MAG: NTP transferase domain-containing protein [Muribaculaceae bacterium]|nr:NTP transferase domain-containing protein [Muribaculaceae bacterium]